ncbi:MAG: YabP/YqfC family sporulation protein [Bacilli bacterium]|nr:YabP/YqfC family sporulation protein [Bacilli bacterium]
MFNTINNYINDKEFRFTVYNDKIHIVNFKRIITLEDNYISLVSDNKKIIINGSNLSLKKLLDNEMIIKGNASKIEVSND